MDDFDLNLKALVLKYVQSNQNIVLADGLFANFKLLGSDNAIRETIRALIDDGEIWISVDDDGLLWVNSYNVKSEPDKTTITPADVARIADLPNFSNMTLEKFADLTTAKIKVLVNKVPEYMCEIQPAMVYKVSPALLARYQPEWVAWEDPFFMARFNQAWMIENRPSWMCDMYPDVMSEAIKNKTTTYTPTPQQEDKMSETINAVLNTFIVEAGIS